MSRAHSSAGAANSTPREDTWLFLLLCFPSSAERGSLVTESQFGSAQLVLFSINPSNSLCDLGHVTKLEGGMCDTQSCVCRVKRWLF